jgi:tetratricopeptide (TPR) repeat protein
LSHVSQFLSADELPYDFKLKLTAMSLSVRKKNYPISPIMLAGGCVLALLSLPAAANNPETSDQIFLRVWPSVMAVDMVDADGKISGQGSGVIVEAARVITSCEVVKEGKTGRVHLPGRFLKAVLQNTEPNLNLCQLKVPYLQAVPITLGKARTLSVGDRVYAVGAQRRREGWEPILSEGVVINLRPHAGSQYIQVSTAISPSFRGGGLFDEQGRLVGILSLQFIEGQNLTFALPVDWISELANRAQSPPAAAKKNGLNWLNHTLALEKKENWRELLKLSQQEVKHDPSNAAAWFNIGIASVNLKHYNQAVHAYREAIRSQAEYGAAWHRLGVVYAHLKEYDHAIHAYRDALRIQPENAGAWHDLGNTHYSLKQYAHAIYAYREALRIQPENPKAWYNLGIIYDDLKLYGDAVEAYRETVRIQPENADAWYKLGVDYAIEGERDKMREVYQALRRLDGARAELYFNTYILP